MPIPEGPFTAISVKTEQLPFDVNAWNDLSSPYPSPASYASSTTFNEDALIAFPSQSPYEPTSSGSPFSTSSDGSGGYADYSPPTLTHSHFDLSSAAATASTAHHHHHHHHAWSNPTYEQPQWERYRQATAPVGYLY